MAKQKKYEALQAFRDKNTMRKYVPGNEYLCKDEDRVELLKNEGYIREVANTKGPDPDQEPDTGSEKEEQSTGDPGNDDPPQGE